MQLSNGGNTISDSRFEAVEAEMFDRHCYEYEIVHNGSGLSEEMPSDLRARQMREHEQLICHRQNMSIMQWLRRYPTINIHP